MKKLLSIVLALALTLALGCPAWAAEELDPATVAEIAEKYGLDEPEDVPDTEDGDFGYSIKLPEPLPDEDYVDPYEEYEAAHPEEIAALDVEKLIAVWGYKDMTAEESFLVDYEWYGDTVEDAVKGRYIDQRLAVEHVCQEAEDYRAKYSEEWAAFDADAYFEKEILEGQYRWGNKAEYTLNRCILTEEEFVDYMFMYYVYDDLEADYDYGWWGVDTDEPTLTLYVNGVATDVELTAGDGATYADADALRQILGPDAVSTDQAGPIAIRPAAEAAGWDVGWYSSWWGNRQEVQLWDKAGFEGFLNEEFAPLNEFLAKAMEQSKGLLFSEKATAGHETVTVDLKRFSTLDGDKDYKLTLAVDYIVQSGVMDMTCTFDLSQLLQLFDGNDLKAMTKAGGFTPTQLSSLLRAGKAEVILDYNEGMVAYNVPLLALFDEDMAGWQSQYVPGLDTVMERYEEMGEAAFTSSLYAQMLTTAGYSGAEYAFEQYDQTVSLLTLFAGKDRFTTKNGKTTYSFTTEGVNAALAALLAQTSGVEETELAGSSFFKACDLTYTLDSSGNVTMEAHVRPDREGITAAMAAVNGEMDPYYTYGTAMAMKWMLSFFDMDVTASVRGNQSRATQRVDVHWNNVGKLSMNTTTTTQPTTKAPRQVEDVVK